MTTTTESINRDRLDAYITGMGGMSTTSKKLDVDRSTLYRWCTGQQPIPGIMLANLKLCDKIAELHKTIAQKDQLLREATK